jgi:hypothetical protein
MTIENRECSKNKRGLAAGECPPRRTRPLSLNPPPLPLSCPGYHALPALRRRLRRAASATAGLAALRTLWAAAMPVLAGDPLPAAAVVGVAAAAAALGAAHAFGSAFGRPHKERRGLLGLLPALAFLLAALVIALAGFEHTAAPREARRPAQAARVLTARAGLPAPFTGAAARALDAAADGGVVAGALCVGLTARAYNKLAAGGKRD